jgi:hypothetical protein
MDPQTCSLADVVLQLPAAPLATSPYTENFLYIPPNRSSSPSWATTSPATSLSPSRTRTTVSRARYHPPASPEIDYIALSEYIPTLRAALAYSADATQALLGVIDLVALGLQPTDSLLKNLVVHAADEYRCPVSTCNRHEQGNGWVRLDHARGHFRTEHLGSYFSCRIPGWWVVQLLCCIG